MVPLLCFIAQMYIFKADLNNTVPACPQCIECELRSLLISQYFDKNLLSCRKGDGRVNLVLKLCDIQTNLFHSSKAWREKKRKLKFCCKTVCNFIEKLLGSRLLDRHCQRDIPSHADTKRYLHISHQLIRCGPSPLSD